MQTDTGASPFRELSMVAAQMALAHFDSDRDGRLSFQEFTHFSQQVGVHRRACVHGRMVEGGPVPCLPIPMHDIRGTCTLLTLYFVHTYVCIDVIRWSLAWTTCWTY
jgi:hypothetical protein